MRSEVKNIVITDKKKLGVDLKIEIQHPQSFGIEDGTPTNK
jgi:hypothetical protein